METVRATGINVARCKMQNFLQQQAIQYDRLKMCTLVIKVFNLSVDRTKPKWGEG
jgi:hypothetical protein